jgi:DNA-binding transcriptional MerR regulator
MRIGEVSRRTGVAPSCIRYYEKLGLLPPAERISGKRAFSAGVLSRLALIQHAQACGLRLLEMKGVLDAGRDTRPRMIWGPIVAKKLDEIRRLEDRLAAQRESLVALRRCRCRSLDDCARRVSSGK